MLRSVAGSSSSRAEPFSRAASLTNEGGPVLIDIDRRHAPTVEVQHAFDLVSAGRNTRNERGMSPKEALEVMVRSRDSGSEAGVTMRPAVSALVNKLANVSAITAAEVTAQGAVTFLVGTTEYAIDLGGNIDVDAEVKKAEAELDHLRGFLASVEKKLGNERFVAGAPPQVLENEHKKKADAEAKIKALEERLVVLK